MSSSSTDTTTTSSSPSPTSRNNNNRHNNGRDIHLKVSDNIKTNSLSTTNNTAALSPTFNLQQPPPPSSGIVPPPSGIVPPIRKVQHTSTNESISSITSNASDLTIYESSICSIMTSKSQQTSNETLVEPQQNHIIINEPSCSGKLFSFDENDEEDKNQHNPFFNVDLSTTRSPPPVPQLKKQMTLPSLYKKCPVPPLATSSPMELSFDSIKSEQAKRLHYIPTQNFKPQIEKLSNRIHYMSPLDINNMLNSNHCTHLAIDIRPFNDYIKSHLKSSLNICLPSTLLKRPNFSLSRCMNSLPDYEMSKFSQFLEDPQGGDLIIYDSNSNSSNLYHVCNKFIQSPSFQNSMCQIYLVDTNFTQFHNLYPHLFESGTISSDMLEQQQQQPQDCACNLNNYLPPIIVPSARVSRSQSVSDISPYRRSNPNSSSSSSNSPSMASSNSSLKEKLNTPILANFTLPSKSTTFKLRHNEELLQPPRPTLTSYPTSTATATTKSPINQYEVNNNALFRLENIPDDKSVLPNWIKSTILNNNGEFTGRNLNDNFYILEKLEQKRLVKALSLSDPILSPINETPLQISKGIEYGHKNRYKDIFLYEHSRVKLDNNEGDDSIENYINASYVTPSDSFLSELVDRRKLGNQVNYIATQGPLDDTMGDFWKCVYNLNSCLIISLTDEIENGVMKCSPFWKSGIYHRSQQDSISVQILQEFKYDENLIIRRFVIRFKEKEKRIIQVQLISWPDMGTIIDPDHILQIIQLKEFILRNLDDNNDNGFLVDYPTIVHCSAGCGRTGTLCVIDTIINLLKTDECKLIQDPIFDLVNDFRKQRISMVQNLRQYYLIYEVLLVWMNRNDEKLKKWNELIQLDIVKQFIKSG
ncbi:PTP3 [[Candida] subhashii]|uniref:PTP3 n=1 Tax=[Candida] subhashii TaxID=561895 RepID=A0A8J5UNC5_9ASCO|nr:PTP3 [[Candida] subhashii]KAG7663721.1 PTP3 [[Candida] subhashii]